MTAHPSPEQLALWAGGDLPVLQRPKVERHLEACGACREAVQDLRAQHEVPHGPVRRPSRPR